MNQQIKQLIEKLVGYWKKLEKRQKRNLLIVSAFFVLTVALLSWFALRPNYVVAFKNQTPASLGQIAQKLDELKIPYQAGADTISVPEQYQYDVQMKIAMAGLPQSSTNGYSVFDQSSIGMTQDEFNVRYKQALESNIQNAIQTLQGVHQAQVNIVMAQKPLFVTDHNTSDSKASIVLLLDPGVKLSTDQINGIQQLVSHSVDGMQASDVSIVDQNGTRLVDDNGQAVAMGGSTQLTQQQQIENQVEGNVTNKIRDALERLEGLNNVDVVVHADIDFSQLKWKDKKLTSPTNDGKGAIISQQTSSQDTQGSQGSLNPSGNNPPNNGNIPGYTSPSSGSSSSSNKSNTTNYDYNQYTDEGQSAPYQIKSYSVSVLLNDPNLTQAKKDEITKFVSTAIGQSSNVTAATASTITVTGGSFQAPANPFTNTSQFYKQPWFIGLMAAALVLLGGGVFFASRRRTTLPEVEMVAPPRRDEPPMVVEESENQKMKKQLEKLANQKPEDFVNLLRTWLVEE